MNNEILIKKIFIGIIVVLFIIMITCLIIHLYNQSKFLTIDSIEDKEIVQLLSNYYESIQNKDIESLKNLIDLNDFNEFVDYESTEEDLEEVLKNIVEKDYYVNINKIIIVNYEIDDDGNTLIYYYYKDNYTSAYINSEYKLICISSLYSEYKIYHTLKYIDANGL